MHSWTRSLSKVEKINRGRYGLSPIITLRGVMIDCNFLWACTRLWDPEAHVFRFGAMMEEMCPLFEEFCAIIGCDPNAPLVKHEVRIEYVQSFESLFQFSRPQARAMIVGDQKAILLPLIDEFSGVHSDDPDWMRLRIRALVFCLLAGFLFNKDPGFGDLRLCPMFRQMEDMGCIGGIVLAETIRSLDRAALGFEDWTVSLIILQDHLQVVATPTSLPYNPSQYRMRRILITHPSADAWTSWLIESGPNEVLWFISWYGITRFIQVSFRHTQVYLLGLTHCTWYCASCVLRQMGIDQTVPIMDDSLADSAITPGVTRAVLRAWVRDNRMVRPSPNPAGIQTSPEYRTWFMAVVWPIERPRRNALLSALEGWVQADADNEVETEEELVLALRTGEVGESSAARDDPEDVAPRRRRDA
ncbi:hypothetical protein JCGZ_19358 [Jatropha curcas]|uniref:Aminotransferase-like plant mobile domain-containing protein n=1 Tax=Jatropha curcas TaxID=180498 RepID=A0A067K0C1_JATCU|nr:hypothetical protein JCGZ_19358 [Jatropha curcas]